MGTVGRSLIGLIAAASLALTGMMAVQIHMDHTSQDHLTCGGIAQVASFVH